MMKNERSPNDPSYEPNRLYNLFGRPALGTGMLIVLAIFLVVSLVVVAISELVV